MNTSDEIIVVTRLVCRSSYQVLNLPPPPPPPPPPLQRKARGLCGRPRGLRSASGCCTGSLGQSQSAFGLLWRNLQRDSLASTSANHCKLDRMSYPIPQQIQDLAGATNRLSIDGNDHVTSAKSTALRRSTRENLRHTYALVHIGRKAAARTSS
jgi:hypothetical protein